MAALALRQHTAAAAVESHSQAGVARAPGPGPGHRTGSRGCCTHRVPV